MAQVNVVDYSGRDILICFCTRVCMDFRILLIGMLLFLSMFKDITTNICGLNICINITLLMLLIYFFKLVGIIPVMRNKLLTQETDF